MQVQLAPPAPSTPAVLPASVLAQIPSSKAAPTSPAPPAQPVQAASPAPTASHVPTRPVPSTPPAQPKAPEDCSVSADVPEKAASEPQVVLCVGGTVGQRSPNVVHLQQAHAEALGEEQIEACAGL